MHLYVPGPVCCEFDHLTFKKTGTLCAVLWWDLSDDVYTVQSSPRQSFLERGKKEGARAGGGFECANVCVNL